ncbi:relaxase/mobilization nuclease domain-containing protein [Chryseobacterium sp.]|uniref:relaxase/mobilization nuclease domain-containing protein n=1 Tax=Chryseobacterium sp. TaxID=1871047 RepID=UPI0028A1634F|nr:relaxase/mobilization nuclease domain-containing protein [Chryseobacterium sp.]
MIVKILGSASSDFHGVQYNDKKVEKGKGELMLMKNFPSFINEKSKPEVVRNYLKSISINEKVKKPQFHAVISTKFQEHNKDEITRTAEEFMNGMGYGKQPFIVVFHNDTENNHVHIVSTRVDKDSGRKINDSYEKLKAQKVLAESLEKLYGIDEDAKLSNLLNYSFGSLKQLEVLLKRSGYKITTDKSDNSLLTISKNGVLQRKISGDSLVFTDKKNDSRIGQLRAIFAKYSKIHSNKVFKVEDFRRQEAMLPEDRRKAKEEILPVVEFESELQKKLRDVFGLDIVFHHKENYQPFGYTIIDHKTRTVYKGSDIMKMKELFEFTSGKMDKKLFESLKDFNIPNDEIKKIMLDFLYSKYPESNVMEFMLFDNKKLKNRELFSMIRNDVKEYVKTQKGFDIGIFKAEDGKYFVIHSRLHYIGELQSLIGEKQYQQFLNPEGVLSQEVQRKAGDELDKAMNDLFFELMKYSGSSTDPAEEELRKRRRQKKR